MAHNRVFDLYSRMVRHPLRVGAKAGLWLLTTAFPRWRSMLLVVGRKSAAASQ